MRGTTLQEMVRTVTHKIYDGDDAARRADAGGVGASPSPGGGLGGGAAPPNPGGGPRRAASFARRAAPSAGRTAARKGSAATRKRASSFASLDASAAGRRGSASVASAHVLSISPRRPGASSESPASTAAMTFEAAAPRPRQRRGLKSPWMRGAPVSSEKAAQAPPPAA